MRKCALRSRCVKRDELGRVVNGLSLAVDQYGRSRPGAASRNPLRISVKTVGFGRWADRLPALIVADDGDGREKRLDTPRNGDGGRSSEFFDERFLLLFGSLVDDLVAQKAPSLIREGPREVGVARAASSRGSRTRSRRLRSFVRSREGVPRRVELRDVRFRLRQKGMEQDVDHPTSHWPRGSAIRPRARGRRDRVWTRPVRGTPRRQSRIRRDRQFVRQELWRAIFCISPAEDRKS